MAEPVIISFARGLLKEFPGVPEGTVDVIPVDLVVAAIIAVAAVGPERAAPITQVASGSANPLKYRVMVDNTTAWFREHPLYDAEGQPIVVPDWSFPGRGRVQGQLNRAKSILTQTEKVLQALPLRGQQAEWSARLEEKRLEVERALEYVELYGLYAECEAIYGVDHLLALADSLPPEDREAFNFDPRVIDWPRYITETHLPSVIEHARVEDDAGQDAHRPGGEDAPQRALARPAPRRVRPREHPHRQQRGRELLVAGDPPARPRSSATRYALRTTAEIPSLLALDRKDRSDFLRFFYRRYEDAPVAQLDVDSVELLSAAHHDEELPGRHPPGARASGARVTGPCSSPARWTSW